MMNSVRPNKACLSCILLLFGSQVYPQTARDYFSTFQNQARQEYNNFRLRANLEYIDFLREAWVEYQKMPALHAPKLDPHVPPIVLPEEELIKPLRNERIPFEEIFKPDSNPTTQPEPIVQIPESPNLEERGFEFVFMGTKEIVRIGNDHRIYLADCDENCVANAWVAMCHERYNNVIRDCLIIRQKRSLCDWAYYKMLVYLGEAFYGKNTNESVLLTAFIYSQSGYSMRLANTGGRLEMLFASRHLIYSLPFFEIDSVRFYSTIANDAESYIMPLGFSCEKPMSLLLNHSPQFTLLETPLRILQSERYPDIQVSTTTNKNLIDFFSTYPDSQIEDNLMTRWAIYAETPLSQAMKQNLYPQMKNMLQGYSQLEAANRLLNWVQTAFVYNYDDKVWGNDRVFFAEETLFYPYCDCEDRSILFSRLVRDILGLNVVLVYYPGHLATAVAFSEFVQGDFLMVDGVRYTIADPTYINAPVGLSMPDVNNQTAKVILLR